MRWYVRIAVLGGLSVLAASFAGCSQCGRQVVFDITVNDLANHAIAGASATASCDDIGGTAEQASAPSDSAGRSYFRVTAPNRNCPDNPGKIASYLRSCGVSVIAAGFQPVTRTLSGAEMDALQPATVFEDGNHVPLQFSLSPQ